ncbi:DUF4038 domain-containing protein [Novipirellula sp. SH528]|uniref:apiosidase-like domain-containing protein n=1 Tax=Novipirellula sp. SH528 TaxID=3454466 RepID=UPI003F9F4A5A
MGMAITVPSAADQPAGNVTLQNASTSAQQWEVSEIRLAASELPAQPVDVDVSAKFENTAGQNLEVPGFYDGGTDYVIRFTPPTPGTWNYVTKSSLPAIDGKQGTLSVADAADGRKGGVVIDPKHSRRFRYENGDIYYPIAFECDWLFALDAENADDIPDTRKFVDTLAQQGFNQVVMNVFAYDVNWAKDKELDPKHEYGSPKVFPFAGSNTEPDHSKLNIEYFQRLDRVIDYLDQKGIAAHLMIYVWNKEVNWPEANFEADNRYFDYVVRRYQAYPNLVWDISKEALGYGHNDVNYISQRIERLRNLDAYKRLVTVHDYGYCKRFPEKLDFVSVQLWSSELYSVMRNVCDDFPMQPILNIEHGGYERGPYVVFTGDYTSPEVCLERAYQCVFAGTFPTHYWQGAAWNVIFPDIDAMDAESRPRLDYYRHMRTLIEKYNIGQLKAGDKKSSSGFCLHNNKDLFIYYVPKENEHIGVRLPKDRQGQTMTATWFDPFSGTFGNPIKKAITQWPSFPKPAGDDFAILIVQLQSQTDEK